MMQTPMPKNGGVVQQQINLTDNSFSMDDNSTNISIVQEKESVGVAAALFGAVALVGVATGSAIAAASAIMNLQSSKEKNAARELANKALEDTWLAEARDREPAPEGFVSWVLTSKGHIPPGAFVAGRDIDGSLMYVARAMHQGSLIPGRTSPAFHDGCRIPWNGKEIFKQTYEILIAPAQYLQWVECSSGKWVVPAGIEPLDVGYEADGMPLYAGQVAHEYNSLQLGKCGGHLSGCLIAFSKERCFRNFKFLAYRYW